MRPARRPSETPSEAIAALDGRNGSPALEAAPAPAAGDVALRRLARRVNAWMWCQVAGLILAVVIAVGLHERAIVVIQARLEAMAKQLQELREDVREVREDVREVRARP